MPSRQSLHSLNGPKTYFIRFRGVSTGMAITNTQGPKVARATFAGFQGVPETDSRITVCTKATPGVVYDSRWR